jgi:peptide/nickel transport system ATP-binding protein
MLHSETAGSVPPILQLDRLAVGFGPGGFRAPAVRNVSLAAHRGATLGIVGESGSGKSASLLGPFGLLPSSGKVVGGRAFFLGRDLVAMSSAERRSLLGSEVGFVFQNPVASLNPVLSVGQQIAEALKLHDRSLRNRHALRKAAELLGEVGIGDSVRRIYQYPHEFSGGMCQRVMIAMALANRPKLLIADEPTTAVDVTIQAQILSLLRALRSQVSGAVILVSHDLGVIAENTDEVVVMYAGEVMEAGPTHEVLSNPQHPYTQGLLSCRPSATGRRRLIPIPGQPASAATNGKGCPFVDRCPRGRNDPHCRSVHPLLIASVGSRAACHYAGVSAFASPGADAPVPTLTRSGSPLMDLEEINVDFPMRRKLGQRRRYIRAVDHVSLRMHRGEALGIVGESGSGKSTLARVLMCLTQPTSGRVIFDGKEITRLRRSELTSFRNRVQMVFQDPFGSLDPHLSVGDNAAEPLRIRGVPAAERRRRVLARFAEVGLQEEHYDRDTQALSGGQLQRVGIARALVLDPDVLVMDEPVSALDVSIQAQILNLLLDLKQRRNLSYVFISHDMSVVRYLCDRVAVMHQGRIVEAAAADDIFDRPSQAYTRRLLDAVPQTQQMTGAGVSDAR